LKAPYVTAKHGLIGLAKVVAKEGGLENISIVERPLVPLRHHEIRAAEKALLFARGRLGLTVTLRAPDSAAFELTWSVEPPLRGSHTAVTETSGCFANSHASQSMNTRTRGESCRRCG
jgi:hypothetical protein